MSNEQDVMSELVELARGVGRGESLDLSDRDDLDPLTMVELRSLLMQYRNAIDTVSRSLAEHWYEQHGESGVVDPETGVLAYVTQQSGPYQIEDGDGFAEYLRGLSNEDMIRTISGIRVGGIPEPVRNALLSKKYGRPVLNITHTDNPKAPKWVLRGEEGNVVRR